MTRDGRIELSQRRAPFTAPGAAVPQALHRYVGRIHDVDSHEQVPTILWAQEFGGEDLVAEIVSAYSNSVFADPKNPSTSHIPDYTGDTMEITPETVWRAKGARSPGAFDLHRRLDVLDMMGVESSLIFTTSVGLIGAAMRTGLRGGVVKPRPGLNVDDYTKQLFSAHNDWVIRTQKISPRIRPVAIVQTDDPDSLLASVDVLIQRGVRAVSFIQSELLGGRSPAHEDLDPVWALLASNDVPATLHLGADGGLFKTDAWSRAPVFEGYKVMAETSVDPWTMSTMHLAVQNFLATMVIGGVFERHPTLRFGVLECTAHWVGPLSQQLDMWHQNGYVNQRGKKNSLLPERPSDYIRRNVRVSAFDFEPIDDYMRRFGLSEVYCFSSDYPHVEGGYEPMLRFAERLAPLGEEVMERFFVTNGELLLPA